MLTVNKPGAPVPPEDDQEAEGTRVPLLSKVKASPSDKDSGAAKKSLFGRFQRKPKGEQGEVAPKKPFTLFRKKEAPPAEGVSAQESTAVKDSATPAAVEPKKSLLGRFKASKAKSKEEGSGKAPRASFMGHRENHVDIVAELDSGRTVLWRVTDKELFPLDSFAVKRGVSFSSQDHRYASEGVLNYNQARDLALSELGEECRIVNATKNHQAVYASVATRVQDFTHPVGPGVGILEALLRQGDHLGKDLIAGFLLNSEESGQSLAILYYITPTGVYSAPQITVNPENLDFTLSQFAASKRLYLEEAEVVLFRNHELIEGQTFLELYPAETVWYGVPVRKIMWAGIGLVCVAATGCAAYAGLAYVKKHSLESEKVQLTAQVKTIDQALQSRISESLVSFAATQSINIDQVTSRAGEIWLPFSKVLVEASKGTEKYSMTMPLTRGGFANNRPSVVGQVVPSDVEPLVSLVPPTGCSKDIPGVNGGIDAIQITITCETPASPVSRYRLD